MTTVTAAAIADQTRSTAGVMLHKSAVHRPPTIAQLRQIVQRRLTAWISVCIQSCVSMAFVTGHHDYQKFSVSLRCLTPCALALVMPLPSLFRTFIVTLVTGANQTNCAKESVSGRHTMVRRKTTGVRREHPSHIASWSRGTLEPLPELGPSLCCSCAAVAAVEQACFSSSAGSKHCSGAYALARSRAQLTNAL